MAQGKRNKALDGLATLKASGALSATFHADGTLASVTFGKPDGEPPAQPQAKPAAIIEEALTRTFKTDIDGLDLPSYDDEVSN